MNSTSQRVYNALVPYCADVCVVTQYHHRAAAAGGWGGQDLFAPDSGTGISVNKIFKNVNWVAIPGRDQFFRGGLGDETTLDQASYDTAVRNATSAGWFDGIGIRPEVMRERSATMPVKEVIVRHSIGTDFALTFARTTYCARLPMGREAIGKVIAYLNSANEGAQKNGYIWNVYTNNCRHLAHNALAAAGVWDPKAARGPGAIELARDLLGVANTLEQGWISTGPGALIVSYPMHDKARNRMFSDGRDPFLFSVPVLWDKRNEFKELTRKIPAMLTDVGANLAYFHDRFARTLAHRRSVNDRTRSVRGDERQRAFRAFSDRFYSHISEELHRTDARLAEYRRDVSSASRP